MLTCCLSGDAGEGVLAVWPSMTSFILRSIVVALADPGVALIGLTTTAVGGGVLCICVGLFLASASGGVLSVCPSDASFVDNTAILLPVVGVVLVVVVTVAVVVVIFAVTGIP